MRYDPSVNTRDVKTMAAKRQHSNLVSDNKFRQADGAIGESLGHGIAGVRELWNASQKLGSRQREVIVLGGCNGVAGKPAEAGAASGGVEGDKAK